MYISPPALTKQSADSVNQSGTIGSSLSAAGGEPRVRGRHNPVSCVRTQLNTQKHPQTRVLWGCRRSLDGRTGDWLALARRGNGGASFTHRTDDRVHDADHHWDERRTQGQHHGQGEDHQKLRHGWLHFLRTGLGFGFGNGAAFGTEISCAVLDRPSSRSTNYWRVFVQNRQTEGLLLG